MFKSVIKKSCPKFVLEWYHNLYFFVKRQYRTFKYNSLITHTREHYDKVADRIRNRGNEPLRFASYVVFDSTFGAYGLMDIMLADLKHYYPKIVICPDVSRGEIHLKEQYEKTRTFFVEKYGSEYVVDGYDENERVFLDVSDQFDVVYCANPYDQMVNEVHGIKYLSKKNLLPVYINYGCMVDKYSNNIVMPMVEMSLFWKVFADDEFSYCDLKKFTLCKGKNVVLTGYAKMDDFSKYNKGSGDRLRIIISPHHTIKNPKLPLSNFMKYSDFILQLPVKYPDIEFIFRPHPLLFVNLINEGFWTKDDVAHYLEEVKKHGIVYSTGGDYLKVFADSDAIIHDCASFIVEYLYTNNPCCFAAKLGYKNIFSTLGKSCLENYYIAFDKKQIIDFIDKVVIGREDPLKEKRNNFTKKHLTINHPNVSKIIMKEISLL